EENLKQAIEGESYEFESMYPEMMEDAKAEGENAVLRYFGFANEAEKIHANLYTEALNADGDVFAEAEFYICSVCGHTQNGAATENVLSVEQPPRHTIKWTNPTSIFWMNLSPACTNTGGAFSFIMT
ncbi:hypothetical protein ADUPG1_001304, partial [Aduncisulcus paluster]